MSRQFRFFLLPADIENFTRELRSKVEFEIFPKTSPTCEAVAISSPCRITYRSKEGAEVVSVYCLLAPFPATINITYAPTRSEWLIDEERSEVIQFCGCDFDGSTLKIGRFYTQTAMLIEDAIWPKPQPYLEWVGCMYRAAKKLLNYSKELEAYVGPAAEEWRREGGKFLG